jgi:hypothetical protein
VNVRPSVLGGVGLVSGALWPLLTNWDPIANGHPSYLIFYSISVALGLGILLRGLLLRGPAERMWLSITSGGVLLALGALAIWLSPFAAGAEARNAGAEPGTLSITETATEIVLENSELEPSAGVIFHPGARVDTRAYVGILRPIAEAGHQVVIVKEPLGIAFLSIEFVEKWISSRPDIETWVVGGHSLGGVVAATHAANPRIDGLLLWASYPASDLSDRTGLTVASVYGSRDGLTEEATVEASATELPTGTTFTRVEGAIHSQFADYGTQPGDGEPTISVVQAQAAIVEASLELLRRLIDAER